tara:strand:+ start:1010 stop:1735 length:726 start_codon:yes stop_codon:yes gene_type:complete
MSKIITSSKVQSKVTQQVRWVACDLEKVFCSAKNKYLICEIALYDIHAEQEIFSSVIKPEGDYYLNLWRIEKGYTNEVLSNAKSIEAIDRTLRYLCAGFILCFWNESSDLDIYPNLKTYSLDTRCVMKRWSANFGIYDPKFGDRRFAKLKDAATQSGFKLKDSQFFHTASTDAEATAHLWRYCDQAELPAPSISHDLVERNEIEKFFQKEIEIKDQKIKSLENKLKGSDDDLEDESEAIPF